MAIKQGRTITLYIFVAIPIAFLILYFLNPGIPAKAKDYVQGFVGPAEQKHAPSDPPTLQELAGLQDLELLKTPTEAQTAATPESPPVASQTHAEVQAPAETHHVSEPEAPAEAQPSADEKPSTMTGASRNPSPTQPGVDTSPSATSSDPPKTTGYNEETWWFQGDVENYELPKFDVEKLKYLAPHNYKGPHHETYATLYATRNGTLKDPYFISALQIVYRLLWDPNIKSEHPVTVFVPPFVPEVQRQQFAAAGAVVRELGLLPFLPNHISLGRWKDMFTKLEMWKQTDFSRIVYLDSDAFPVNHTDSIFDAAGEQKCHSDQLAEQDRPYASSICNYVFSVCMEHENSINAGVMVFKPDTAMHARLLRDMYDQAEWDSMLMEQAYLNYVFRQDGPFPANIIPKEWNANGDHREKTGLDPFIVHDKMWAHFFDETWVTEHYKQTWADMLKLYESEEFVRLRNEDQEHVMAELG